MSYHRVCCCLPDDPDFPPCCGCGSCAASLTLDVTQTYVLRWTLGGACDLTQDVVERTIMPMSRIASGSGICNVPPYPAGSCNDCVWEPDVGATHTITATYREACAGADPAPIVYDIEPFTSGTEFAGLRCGTCFGSPASFSSFWQLKARTGPSAGNFVFFDADGPVNASTLCPESMDWTVVTTGLVSVGPGYALEDYDLVWTLT